MTLYGRSDLMCVSVSRAHGGCGDSHTRKTVDGVPEKLWGLECPQCEVHLKDDPCWSGTVSELPETHDEEVVRLDQEKRGQREMATATGTALEKLSSLPEVMAQFLAIMMNNGMGPVPTLPVGVQGPVTASVLCPEGHQVTAGAKFCGECGAEVRHNRIVDGAVHFDPLPSEAEAAETARPVKEYVMPDGFVPRTETAASKLTVAPTDLEATMAVLRDLPQRELQQRAREMGVPTVRGKADQLDLLAGHLSRNG